MASSRARVGVVAIIGLPELNRALQELGDLGRHGGMTAVIGTDLVDPPYPYFLEYGTSRMGARPSARPAYDEMSSTAVSTTGDVMGQLIVSGRRDPTDVIRPALTEGARPIENRWKELAPYATGTYRRSIHTEVVDGTGP
jgi:hypothetical protein